MMRRLRALCLVLATGPFISRAEMPPEMVAVTPAPSSFHEAFEARPLSPQLRRLINKTTWRAGCPVFPEDLRLLVVSYWDYAARPAEGQLLVNQDVVNDLLRIFEDLFHYGFMIQHMQPVEYFGGSDARSMAANNTSAFNCRDITGEPGKFSVHSYGRAIDINPLTNPYVKGEEILPWQGRAFLDRTRAHPGSILARSYIVRLFENRGWTWGGSWKDRQDYQHFEKPEN